MRIVKYKTHWSYLGPGIPRENTLAEFLLDIPYLMLNTSGVIPPFAVLKKVLGGGGSSGGMGPDTSWRPFQLKPEEYPELVEALLAINPEEARKNHPYVYFQKVIVDEELADCEDEAEWSRRVAEKYPLTD